MFKNNKILNIRKCLFLFSILFLSPVFVFAQIEITEIMYDLESGSDSGREWVEIYNSGSTEINLEGWKFFENNSNHSLRVFPEDSNCVLPTGGIAIISDNPSKFLVDCPQFSGIIFDSAFSLSNTGEALVIKNSELEEIDSVNYTVEQGANGDGNSLQKNGNGWLSGQPNPGSFSGSEEEEQNTDNSNNSTSQETPTFLSTIKRPDTSNGIRVEIFGIQKSTIFAKVDFEGQAFWGKSEDVVDGARYFWNFGDGITESRRKVSHSYDYVGDYLVVLDVEYGNYSSSEEFVIRMLNSEVEISSINIGEKVLTIKNKTKLNIDLTGWEISVKNLVNNILYKFKIPKSTKIISDGEIRLSFKTLNLRVNKGEEVNLLYSNEKIAHNYVWEDLESVEFQKSEVVSPTVFFVEPKTEPEDVKKNPVFNTNFLKESAKQVEQKESFAEEFASSSLVATITEVNNSGGFFGVWFWVLIILMVIAIISIIVSQINSEEGEVSGFKIEEI